MICYHKIELAHEKYCTLSVLAEETKLPILSFSSSHSFFFKYKDFVGSVPLLGFSNSAIVPSDLYLSGLVVSESRSLLFFTEKDKIRHEYKIDRKACLNTEQEMLLRRK